MKIKEIKKLKAKSSKFIDVLETSIEKATQMHDYIYKKRDYNESKQFLSRKNN